jgi:hypothetical protein
MRVLVVVVFVVTGVLVLGDGIKDSAVGLKVCVGVEVLLSR